MIEVIDCALVDKVVVQRLRETAKTDSESGCTSLIMRGLTTTAVLRELDLWEDDSMEEKIDIKNEESATVEDCGQLTTLLDRLDEGEMDEKEAIEFALAYFEGAASADMSKKYSVSEICDLMWALHRCEA